MKTLMKRILLFTIIICSLFLIIWIFRLDRFGFSTPKWVDGLKYQGSFYNGQYVTNDDRKLVDEELIGEKIGKIKFRLSGNVYNSYYKMRNFDATVLDENTKLYKIKNQDIKEVIAVKIENKYYLYTCDNNR